MDDTFADESSTTSRVAVRENIPLKNDLQGSSSSRPSSNDTGGRQFKAIVVCMAAIAVVTFFALFADIARDPTQLLQVHRGTVYADVNECITVGRQVLSDGGNAVDVAIASFMCLTVAAPHSASLGGGGFMLIHEPGLHGHQVVINFREVAPYHLRRSKPLDTVPSHGAKVATPGLLRSLQIAHDHFGKLPWKRLILPAFKLAKDGFLVTHSLSKAIAQSPPQHPALVQLLLPNGVPVQVGDVATWKALASTLKTIAEEGPDAFYSGNLTVAMIDGLQAQGSLLTMMDFDTYSAVIEAPLEIPIGAGGKLLVPPLPSSAPGLALVLSMLATTFNDTTTTALRSHRLIEAIKIAIAAVVTTGSPLSTNAARDSSQNMLSSASVAEGRAHIKDDSAIALNSVPALRMSTSAASVLVEADGTMVALIGSLGSTFGSQVMTSNGVLFNDALEDFFPSNSDAAYKNNVYAHGRRPLSPVAVAALLMEGVADAPCPVRLMGASADFQTLTQGLLDILEVRFHGVEASSTLNEVLERPRIRVTLGHSSSEGDVAVYGNNNTAMSALLIDQLHELGHIVYETDISQPQISCVRETGSSIEISPKNPSEVGQ